MQLHHTMCFPYRTNIDQQLKAGLDLCCVARTFTLLLVGVLNAVLSKQRTFSTTHETAEKLQPPAFADAASADLKPHQKHLSCLFQGTPVSQITFGNEFTH